MSLTFDVERLAQWVSARWERPSTIIFLTLAIFFAGISKFTDSELSDLSFWELSGILFFCALVYYLWRRSTAIPITPRNYVGFAVAIHCENEAVEKTIVADFLGSLQRLLSSHQLTHKFHLIRIPQHHAVRIKDADDATRLLAQSRCHFILYGTARDRNAGGKEKHILNLDFQVAHRPIPKQLSQQLAREMSELFPSRLHIDRENDFVAFEFTSEWIDCVTQYTIGIAASLSGDLAYAESLFLSLWQNRHLQDSKLLPFKKMRQRVPIRLGEIYNYHANQLYDKWRNTRQPDLMDELWIFLVKVRNFYPDNYSSRLLAAIYFFVSKRDVDAAIREVLKARNTVDGTWRYSYAFLLAYKGELLKAMRMYRLAEEHHSNRADVSIQCEEFMLWVLEQEPDCVQLHYCLGLINWHHKGDIALAHEHFRQFIEKCNHARYTEAVRLATIYSDTLKAEIDRSSEPVPPGVASKLPHT